MFQINVIKYLKIYIFCLLYFPKNVLFQSYKNYKAQNFSNKKMFQIKLIEYQKIHIFHLLAISPKTFYFGATEISNFKSTSDQNCFK